MKTEATAPAALLITKPIFQDQDDGEAMRELYVKLPLAAQVALLGLATAVGERQAAQGVS